MKTYHIILWYMCIARFSRPKKPNPLVLLCLTTEFKAVFPTGGNLSAPDNVDTEIDEVFVNYVKVFPMPDPCAVAHLSSPNAYLL